MPSHARQTLIQKLTGHAVSNQFCAEAQMSQIPICKPAISHLYSYVYVVLKLIAFLIPKLIFFYLYQYLTETTPVSLIEILMMTFCAPIPVFYNKV